MTSWPGTGTRRRPRPGCCGLRRSPAVVSADPGDLPPGDGAGLPGGVLVAGRPGRRPDRQPGDRAGRRVPRSRGAGPRAADRYWQVPTLMWLDSSDRALHVLCWGGVVDQRAVDRGRPGRGMPGAALAGLPLAGERGAALPGLPVGRAPAGVGPAGDPARPLGPPAGPGRAGAVDRGDLAGPLARLPADVPLGRGQAGQRRPGVVGLGGDEVPLRDAAPADLDELVHAPVPSWFQAASVGFTFWAELVAPFFVFGPRRVRMVGLASIVLLQVLIAATGNFGFFNLLTIVLCATLVEDRDWGRKDDEPAEAAPRPWWRRGPLGVAAAVIVAVTTMEGLDRSGLTVVFPGPLEEVRRWVAPWRSMNAYGLFAVMTTERPGDRGRGQPGRRALGALLVPLEAGRRRPRPPVRHPAPAPAGLADVVRGPVRRLPEAALVPRLRAAAARGLARGPGPAPGGTRSPTGRRAS